METADVVLMQDDLTHLPETVRTARKTRTIIIRTSPSAWCLKPFPVSDPVWLGNALDGGFCRYGRFAACDLEWDADAAKKQLKVIPAVSGTTMNITM